MAVGAVLPDVDEEPEPLPDVVDAADPPELELEPEVAEEPA